MAIIYSYPVASAVEAGDLVIGTDITGKQTKNFTLQSIVDLIVLPDNINGTVGTIPVFTGTKAIGDSWIIQTINPSVSSGKLVYIEGSLGVDASATVAEFFEVGESANILGSLTVGVDPYSNMPNSHLKAPAITAVRATSGSTDVREGIVYIGGGVNDASGSSTYSDSTLNLYTKNQFEDPVTFTDAKAFEYKFNDGYVFARIQAEDYAGGNINPLWEIGDVESENTTYAWRVNFGNYAEFSSRYLGVTAFKVTPSSVEVNTPLALTDDIDMNASGKIINLLDPTDPQDAATKSYVDSQSSLQGLQSVLDTGKEWTSSNGVEQFSLLEGNNSAVGEIKFNNTAAIWGYNLTADEGLSFNNGSGVTSSIYKASGGFDIKGTSMRLEYTDTDPSGYVYIQEEFGNAFAVANRRIWDNPGGQGIQTTFSSNEPGGTVHWQYQNAFAWSVNDTDRILDITSNGRVGIKNTNPQRELDVGGGIRVRGPLDLFQQNDNSFAGTNAGNYFNVVGNSNAAFGEDALAAITSASRNTAVGFKSLKENISGNNNVSVGHGTLEKNTVASNNTAVGDRSMMLAVDGTGNTAVGQESLLNQTSGNFNVSIGRRSGEDLTTGFRNTFIGHEAGGGVTDGQGNIYIGDGATIGQNTTNAIVIGATQSELGSNTATIGNSDITQTLIHGSISFEQHNGTNVRNLISTTDTNPNCAIEIGQTGTSLIDAINLKPGDAGGHIDLYNSTSVAARFKSSRLLIGDLLDVSKALDKTIDIQDNDPFIRLENSIGRKLDLWVEPNTVDSYVSAEGGNSRLTLKTGGSDRVHIANDGSVGIGTTSPGSILDIVEPTNKAEVKLRVSSDQDTAVSFENPNRIFKVGYDTSKDVFKIANSSFNSKNFTIAPDGNCGIGTDEPSRDLHISSSSAAIELENTSQSDCFINFKNPGRTFKVGYDDSSDVWKVAKSTFGDNALTINGDDGRVGLGTQTTDASAILELDSDVQGFLMPRLTTPEINAISAPATGLAVYNTSINTICFYNGSTWQKVSHTNM